MHLDNKATRLVDYLIKIAELQRKPVKKISNYQHVFWFSDVPELSGCYTKAWGDRKGYSEDVWLEVQHQHEPPVPAVPDKCREWVDEKSLKDKSEIPLLRDSIERYYKNPDWSGDSDSLKYISYEEKLDNNPDVDKRWEKFIDDIWLPWTEEHNDWELKQNIYSKLFSIYQDQNKLGEEYELVIGLGLLTWQVSRTEQIQRHVLSANVTLEFESTLRKFTVRPNLDGVNLRYELDMLENHGAIDLTENMKNMLSEIENNPWDQIIKEEVLPGLINSIGSEAEYHDNLRSSTAMTTEKPVLDYAPALILRRRSIRGLSEVLKSIREKIKVGREVGDEFSDLAETNNYQGIDDLDSPKDNGKKEHRELYFPKPSNEEQRKIINLLDYFNGVLVQGPPGTGKSHTIANLITHMLADNKRILVTAKTPRALKVIEKLLPPEIRPLCVNLLGSGNEEKRSLENSIGAILQTTQNWQRDKTMHDVNSAIDNLDSLRKEQASLEKRIITIRESETYPQVIVDGNYKGTAAQIALAAKGEEPQYSWFQDKISHDLSPPFSSMTVIRLLDEIREIDDEKRNELNKTWPKELPQPDQLEDLITSEKELRKNIDELTEAADMFFVNQLQNIDAGAIDALLNKLKLLYNNLNKVNVLPYKWVHEALVDIANGNTDIWRDLYVLTQKSLKPVAHFINNIDDINVSFPDDYDPKALCEDVNQLFIFLSNGGKLKWGPLCPAHVRPLLYITKNVKINGRECKTAEQLTCLVRYLRTKIEIGHLEHLWGGKIDKVDGPYLFQYHEYKKHLDLLDEVLELHNNVNECQQAIKDWYRGSTIVWHDTEELDGMIRACELALLEHKKNNVEMNLNRMLKLIEKDNTNINTHPIVETLITAIKEKSSSDYRKLYNKIEKLNFDKQKIKELDDNLEVLSNCAPKLVQNMLSTRNDVIWDQRLEMFEPAFNWARAKSWLDTYINTDNLSSLNIRLNEIERKINACITKLSALKAWSFSFERMSEHHRRHMNKWQYHMTKHGKGTGKYAPHHRKEARKSLEECREAVPAWVMPLHRIWDTVTPNPGMFDVVIVDEASQCGLEALPLFYMGNKILIVGDDKQISPDAVGVDQEIVLKLMEEYLSDFQFKTMFNVTSSLFDQASLRYSTKKVVLREHFRCMPEIIEFSNNWFYSGQPLIPLRQYGPNRLTPLNSVRVDEGYREGEGSRAINKPEADALTEKIVELCKDDNYVDKTMGVIVLQGQAQASYIESRLLSTLGAEEMERRDIVCGNPYSFQGDERDVMFLSMVAAPNVRVGAMSKSADGRRFNVAASRAKDQMWLFHSVTRSDLSESCYRYKLIAFFEDTSEITINGLSIEELDKINFNVDRAIASPPEKFDSWFELDVALMLARRGYKVISQYEVAGRYIDLVVECEGIMLAIECDGDKFHGTDSYEADLNRQKMLERCGWSFVRIRESEFYANQGSVISSLERELNSIGIYPGKLSRQKKNPEAELTQNNLDLKGNSDYINGGIEFKEKIQRVAPGNVQDALKMKYPEFRDYIIATLKSRPNQTCVKDSVGKYLLQYLGIKTRGKPREDFNNKVILILSRMEKAGIINTYKAKNTRVKLEKEPDLSVALDRDNNS